MINTLQKSQSLANKDTALILWYNQVNNQDVGLVGGKNASLGEMIQQLKQQGVNVPDGFATTAYAFRHFIAEARLEEKLRELFAQMDINDVNSLQKTGKKARSLILNTPFPDSLKTAITEAYEELCQRYGDETDVAVRSSATAEDLPEASFAGQQETYLNIHSVQGVLEACHKCFASLFTNRAISYRENKGFDHLAIALSVGVQKMVRSDLASAGVMFSIDTETGFKNAALITAAYGLGENVVQGAVNPDEYLVFKPTLSEGYQPILDKRLGTKGMKMIYDTGGSKQTHNVAVSPRDRAQFCLQDDEILQLARWAITIEDHYSSLRGHHTPMDIEWAKDGLTGEIFIVQARPETVQSQKVGNILQTYQLQDHSTVLATGRSVGSTIGQGKARVIIDAKNIDRFQPGEVLVTKRTDPDWEPIMKQASAIVTDQGGRTCHAAIIAREMGIPAIVGCGDATKLIQSGQEVTVCCSEGEEGKVYEGLLPFQVQENSLEDLPQTHTQILMNIGNPDQAFSLAGIPADGVGLARLEFIITNHIKAHPLALLYFDQLEDERVQDKISELTRGYDYKPDFFVDQLARGVGMIAAAFYPKPVIVRMSDFKTNEYANLLGGNQFEPKEENPMLGWRGASRYCDPNYREAFALECKALKKVRDEMGLTNLVPMIPFCRTPQEGRDVIAEMAKNGLEQGVNGLEVYVMCELPSNVILADQFSDVFDGFSIGSNDLTQLTLGLDRDSGLVAHLFDERDEAVKRMVKLAIETAKKKGRKIGICGQAPSDYPEFAEFLVEAGIDSMSLNPDSVLQTILNIAEVEQRV
ncbi:phosphoenolpyruvate synthase [Euhalothece natronophila Z-M001]|uniref:Phosphoenolpyruvate synthase n=1 Tax=Euhalothece natronophila Z-M001 TaxID=522448 RepID=A0A5B8NNW7_9CHRO|nr:phosphoenolpyruvate synthase [Euhalothece natronophila]QDZ40647.1 phosphoenolpyruvate synthase [Euhalothece natronophila Z-M001]